MRRNTVLLWLLIVFISGTTVGVATHRYFTRDSTIHEERRPSRAQAREEYLSKMRSRVGATEDQISQIVKILDEGRAESESLRKTYDAGMKALQDNTREKIRAVLSPEQLKEYDAWREERRLQREKHDRDRKARENEKAR